MEAIKAACAALSCITAEDIKNVCDISAGCITLGSLVGALPAIAAGLTAVWTLIRIGDWLYKKLKR
jgi:hypothetical protein